MQQVFWNLPTRTKTHVWEILGNSENPAGVNLDVPFFPTCATPGDLSATISPQFFIEFWNSIKFLPRLWHFIRLSPGCEGFHQVFTRFSRGYFQKFSPGCTRFSNRFRPLFWPGFHQVFTRFSPGFENSPGFHQVFTRFSPSFHQVFTKSSPGFQNSPGFHQVFTRFSLGFHQVFSAFSPSFHQVFTRFSPSFTEFSPGFNQVFTWFWKFIRFSPGFENSPGFHQVLVQWDFRSIFSMKTHNIHQKVGSKHFFWWIWNL